MFYLLVNRKGVIVDAVENYISYTKLQPKPPIVIGCKEDEATGVVGSDCNTGYILAKADTQNNPEAVTIETVEKLPDDYVANEFKWNRETNSIEYLYSLDETKGRKQAENKTAFADFLAQNPLRWTDGKYYGVTEEDQAEISLKINQYLIAVEAGAESPKLEWHAKHEEDVPWSYEELSQLSTKISAFVYPHFHRMQQYKTRIYDCTTIDEVKSIEIVYDINKLD